MHLTFAGIAGAVIPRKPIMTVTPSGPDTEGAPLVSRAPRAHVMLAATVEYFGGTLATRHRVRDLSPGGIRIDQAGPLRTGATVLITVGALEAVGATVKWVRDGQAGLAFAQPIDPEAARDRAMIAPRRSVSAKPHAAAAPRAGWIEGIRDPYRR
jgi:hypothetical protein